MSSQRLSGLFSFFRSWLYWGSGFLLITLTLVCFKLILSAIYLEQVERLFNQAELEQRALTADEFQKADQLLGKAGYWYKSHPQARYYQSWMSHGLWKQNPRNNTEALKDAVAAIDLAIAARPQWPFFYIHKSIILSEYSQLEASFFSAFDQAFKLGRYERNSALALLRVGVMNWYRLPEEYQLKVIELMHLSLQQKSNSVSVLWQIIDAKNLGSWFCFQLPESVRRKELCSKGRLLR